MRYIVLLLVLLFAAFPANAQKRPPGYAEQRPGSKSFTIEQRLRLQVLLTASGYWPAVPNVNFNSRLFEAITSFQQENGYFPNGQFDERQLSHLFDVARAAPEHVGPP